MQYRSKWRAATLAGLALAVLAGCERNEEPAAAAPVTLNTYEATLYRHSCSTCHEDPATGSPQTHDTESWAPRIAKGNDQLLANIVDGFNGMPPLGQCIECTAEEFILLTHFMAAPATEADGELSE